jgi:aryl-alcohol dehydrogenase-like predicted oxidoreductase
MSEKKQFVTWKNLGRSGLKVSNIIVGCMQFGSKGWQSWVEDDEEKTFKILKAAYDVGIRTYDTADLYSNGLSEKLLGKFLKKYDIPRERVVIMTKVYGPVDESYGHADMLLMDDQWTEEKRINLLNSRGLSRKHILDAVDNSLKRLGVSYIDVYQIHRNDTSVPPEEIMRALNDVVESGKARYIGASSMKIVDFVGLQHVADKNNWHLFINVQSEYSLLFREDEHELNYYADKNGVGVTPFSPLAYGYLARELSKDFDSLPTERSKTYSQTFGVAFTEKDSKESDKQIINRVGEIAEKYQTSRASVALAWLLSKGAHPIVGIGKTERIPDLVDATNLKLTEEDCKYLEAPYEPKLRQFLG